MPLTPAPNATKSSAPSDEGATGHYYERLADGKTLPLYEEGGVFGIRRARALTKEGRCALPSVTTIFKDLHKGYLDDVWKPQMVAKEVIKQADDGITTNELLEVVNDREQFNELKAKAFKETDDAATYGTAVHKALEEWLGKGIVDQEYADIVKLVEKEFQKYKWDSDFLELNVSNPELGYAGMCDVIGTADSGTNILPLVVDFKTRKTKPGDTPGFYNTDVMQVVAYGYAHFGARFLKVGVGANIIISTTEPGRIYTRIHKHLPRRFSAFRGLCQFWQNDHNYQPAKV
jgi:hypothetical protein